MALSEGNIKKCPCQYYISDNIHLATTWPYTWWIFLIWHLWRSWWSTILLAMRFYYDGKPFEDRHHTYRHDIMSYINNVVLSIFIDSFVYKKINEITILSALFILYVRILINSSLWCRKEVTKLGRRNKQTKKQRLWAGIAVRWIRWGKWWEEGGVRRRDGN